MNLFDIRVFNKVAETMSLTRAGNQLALSRSAISKRITRLEQELGTVLFHRSARSIALTAAGERFYDHTVKLERDMMLAQAAVKDARNTPYGALSITMPTSLGASLTPLIIREFQPMWPDLQIKVDLDDQYTDVVGGGYDVALRISKRPAGSKLVFHEFTRTPEVLLASRGYLDKHGIPTHISELRDHRCFVASTEGAIWRFTDSNGPAEVTLSKITAMNNELAMILAACLDGGILRAPRLLVESELKFGRLKIILSRFRSNLDYGVFAVYQQQDPPARIRVFIEFVERWLPQLGALDRWDPLRIRAHEQND